MNYTNYLLGRLVFGDGSGSSGGGSGGGSLPAGVYWTSAGFNPPSNSNQSIFWLNGELYLTSGLAATTTLYKLVDGAWTTVLTGITQHCMHYNQVEYNGKVHFIGYSTNHLTFDGTSITSMNDLPLATDHKRCLFVHDGKLKYCSYRSPTIYVWNESDDSWTAEYQIATSSEYTYWAVVNGEAYCVRHPTVYHYSNGTLTAIGTVTNWGGPTLIGHNGALYFLYSNSTYRTCALYKFDLTTNTETNLGLSPFNSASTVHFNDTICAYGLCTTPYNYMLLYEVTG